MQHVGLVAPLNGYLNRINKHSTRDCPWCPGVLEMQMHFQCKCKQFELPGTTAHHNIAKAVISALKEKEEGWKFWYETPFSALPWHFQWASSREARKQNRRRPDGVE
mmetsp:Transcript_29552/g.60606  ORF Transcript_29552/g.60606 Transcript_29552/m.60606 type:complete len:107 (-) Transcript_29552:780-1100(-)